MPAFRAFGDMRAFAALESQHRFAVWADGVFVFLGILGLFGSFCLFLFGRGTSRGWIFGVTVSVVAAVRVVVSVIIIPAVTVIVPALSAFSALNAEFRQKSFECFGFAASCRDVL